MDLFTRAGDRDESLMLSETFLRHMFRVAAVYNVCWGTAIVLFPNLLFDLLACRTSTIHL